MTDYSKQDIIDELLIIKNKPKTREPHIVDRRNYLIAILYYTFKAREEEIFTYTNLDSRSSVNHAKKSAYELYKIKDKLFLKNVDEFIQKYPAEFNSFDVKKRVYNTTAATISITLSHHQLASFTRYMQSKKIDKSEIAAKQLIISVLKLWGE
jgi:hypothetical protein